MKYLDQAGEVVYTGKDRKTNKVFPAMEWLAAMCSHIPNRGEQMVKYYGYYSNVSRGKRQKEGKDDAVPCILEPQGKRKDIQEKLGKTDSEDWSLSRRRPGKLIPWSVQSARALCGSSVR
jgi:hypothetical protein